jgi:hypothetical protein
MYIKVHTGQNELDTQLNSERLWAFWGLSTWYRDLIWVTKTKKSRGNIKKFEKGIFFENL